MSTTSKIFTVAGSAFVAFMGFGFYLANTPDGRERIAQRDTIEACWNAQGGKALTAGSARLVAGACERLEADYRAKWNREP